MTDIKVPELNLDQCKAIYVESLNRGLIKTPDGSVPTDESVLKRDAHDLVEAAMLASQAGNKSDNVNTLIYLSTVDMKPIMPELISNIAHVESLKDNNTVVQEGEFDFSQISDDVLDGLIAGLDKYIETPIVEIERAKFLAEKKRRADETQELPSAEKASQESQSAAEGTSEQTPNEICDASSPAESTVGSQVHSEASGGQGSTGDGAKEDQSEAEDAGSFVRDKATEENGKGDNSSAESSEEDGKIAELREQLNYDIIKAYDIELSKLDQLSQKQLELMIAYPTGTFKENAEEKVKEKDLEIFPHDRVQSVADIQEEKISQPEFSKEVLGLDDQSVSLDRREHLESQVTGPLLKVYGRGRREVPDIGDNELALMIANSDVKITQAQLDEARNKDKKLYNTDSVATNEIQGTKVNLEEFKEVEVTPVEFPENKEKAAGEMNQDDAMSIIIREAMPIPPELTGDGPILPEDVSKISRDELYSLHARFHACESRMNWLVIDQEDKLEDIIKLRYYREVKAAEEVPLVIDDKRVTNEYRDGKVAADQGVLKYKDKEHPIKKTLKRLKVLRDNYCRDCERLSRQMSKYELEKNNAR
jgi:hypothetical protein